MADKKETITALMSRWASGVKFEHLSKDAVYQAKRFLLDSLGCALGGFQQHDVTLALAVLDEIAGRVVSVCLPLKTLAKRFKAGQLALDG